MCVRSIITLLVYFSFSYSFASQNVPAVANTCIGCHGSAGISTSPLWPNLAGQKEGYLVKALNDFKSGQRKDPLMSPMVTTLSEQDINDVAKYFSNLK